MYESINGAKIQAHLKDDDNAGNRGFFPRWLNYRTHILDAT